MTPYTVTVHDTRYVAQESVLGCARYADGSILLVASRASQHAISGHTPIAYRTRGPVGNPARWHMVWAFPDALRQFVTSNPVGTTGKASNRRVEVVDFATVVPNASITIARGINDDNWVNY